MSTNEKVKSVFNILNAIDVNTKTDKKDNLTYLSWADAWGYIMKMYPTATYEISKNDNNLPYFADDSGAMVFTKVTIENTTHEMWLPVMDGKNKAMKKEAYKYSTKYGDKTVEAFTMFDINKTVMRCLVKNIAMFGLGLYIYAKEDLPEPEEIVNSDNEIAELKALIEETESNEVRLLTFFKVKDLSLVPYDKCKEMLYKKKKEKVEA